MARQYRVEGTKDFLVVAIVLLALGVWSVKDGWFPSEGVLKKHPREVPASFSVPGIVDAVRVGVMDTVGEGTILMRLADSPAKDRLAAAEAAHAAALARAAEWRTTRGGASAVTNAPPGAGAPDLAAAESVLNAAREALEACDLKSPVRGEVARILARRDREVAAGEPAVFIRPHDSFYVFNKSLAVLSFLGSIACALIHRRVR